MEITLTLKQALIILDGLHMVENSIRPTNEREDATKLINEINHLIEVTYDNTR